MFKREKTKKIKVGKISIGHSNKVIIQSMCNTKTFDVKSTVKQIKALEDAGFVLVLDYETTTERYYIVAESEG